MAKPSFVGHQRQDSAALTRATWSPAATSHAIIKVVAELVFSEKITSVTIKKMADSVRSAARADGLIKEDDLKTLTFKIEPGSISPTRPEEKVGVAFFNIQGPAAVQTLALGQDSIRFESSIYLRWVGFSAQLSRYLELVLPIAAQSTGAKVLNLEYHDLFIALNEGDADAGLIIDRKSDSIVRRAFKKFDPFHSHAGWFEPINDHSRRLLNVDVNVADSMGPPGLRRTIMVRTADAEHVSEDAHARQTELLEPPVVVEVLDDLHRRLKASLSAVLTRDAQNMISL